MAEEQKFTRKEKGKILQKAIDHLTPQWVLDYEKECKEAEKQKEEEDTLIDAMVTSFREENDYELEAATQEAKNINEINEIGKDYMHTQASKKTGLDRETYFEVQKFNEEKDKGKLNRRDLDFSKK